MFRRSVILVLYLTVSITFSQESNRVELGILQTGAKVSFVRTAESQWGIEISGENTLSMIQRKPAQIEIFQGQEDIQQLASGYQSLQKENEVVIAKAKITGGDNAAFEIEDRWKVSGDVLSLSRKVDVTSTEDNTGFYSAIRLSSAPSVLSLRNLLRLSSGSARSGPVRCRREALWRCAFFLPLGPKPRNSRANHRPGRPSFPRSGRYSPRGDSRSADWRRHPS